MPILNIVKHGYFGYILCKFEYPRVEGFDSVAFPSLSKVYSSVQIVIFYTLRWGYVLSWIVAWLVLGAVGSICSLAYCLIANSLEQAAAHLVG